ncbi:unnamed protein product [Hymenolepis diminuta]|nr:unnamed protein product [Hymenolepis diminuta]
MKLIAPMRSHIEARNRPKGRPQRFVSHVSNFQTNQLTISSQRRKRVFAKLPSAVSMALAATALLTISCSASLLYHRMGSRRSFTSLNCDIPDPCLSIPIFMFPHHMKCNTNRSTLYILSANETQSYSLIECTPRICSVQMSPQLAQNTVSRNSALLLPGIS